MVFEGLLARLVAGEQLLLQIRIAAGRRNEGRHPVFGRHDVVDDGARLDDAGPRGQHRYPKASFVHGAFFATERMIAAIGPTEDFGTIVAGEHDDRVVGHPKCVQLGEQLAHDPVQFGHRIGEQAEARLAVPLLGEVRKGVTACGVVPEEERLVGLHRAVHEVAGTPHQVRLDVLHAHLGGGIHARVRRQRTRVRDLLLADGAPARILRRIIDIGSDAADDVARAEPLAEFRVPRILRVVGFLQRVEVVEDPVEFIEAMNRGQVFVAIPEMVLADLRRRIPERLEEIRDRRIGILQALFRGGKADFQQARAERRLPGDEGGASRGAGLLSVVVGEQRAVACESVDVRRAAAHHAAVVGADVPDADIVGHDHDDIRLAVAGSR